MLSPNQDLMDSLTEKIVDRCRHVRPGDVERDEEGGYSLTIRAAVGPETIEEMFAGEEKGATA